MEEEQGPRGFKIDFSEEEPETPRETPRAAPKTRKAPKQKRRGARPVFVWLLTLFAVGGLLYFGYDHVDKRLSALEARGVNNDMQDLSGRIDERLEAISQLLTKQTEQIKSRIFELEKQVKNNTAAVDNLEKSLENAGSRISDLQSRLKERMDGIRTQIENTASGVAANTDRLKAMEETFKETAGMASELKQLRQAREQQKSRMDQLAAQISALREDQLDADAIESRLQQVRQSIDQQIQTRVNEQVQTRVRELQDRVTRLADQTRALEAILQSLEKSQKSGGSASSSGGGQSGEIIEQEIE